MNDEARFLEDVENLLMNSDVGEDDMDLNAEDAIHALAREWIRTRHADKSVRGQLLRLADKYHEREMMQDVICFSLSEQ